MLTMDLAQGKPIYMSDAAKTDGQQALAKLLQPLQSTYLLECLDNSETDCI